MSPSTLLLLLGCTLVSAASPAPPPAPAGFDCKTRHLALEYAEKIQPFRGKSDFETLASVLDEAGGLPGGKHHLPVVPLSLWNAIRCNPMQ